MAAFTRFTKFIKDAGVDMFNEAKDAGVDMLRNPGETAYLILKTQEKAVDWILGNSWWLFSVPGPNATPTKPVHPQLILLREIKFRYLPISMDFSPDGKMLVVGQITSRNHGRDHKAQTLTMLDVETGAETADIKGLDVLSVAFSPDGQMLATGYRDGTVRLWDYETKALVATLEGHEGPVTAVDFSPPDGTMLVTGSRDDTIRLWDVAMGNSLTNTDFVCLRSFDVYDVQFSPDGMMIATVNRNRIEIWLAANLDTAREIATLIDYTGGETCSARFSPDGLILAVGHKNGTVRLWDLKAPAPVATLEGHEGPVTAVDFLYNGDVLISVSMDGNAMLWDVDTKSHIETIKTGSPIGVMRSSPNGYLFAVANEDRKLWLWAASP